MKINDRNVGPLRPNRPPAVGREKGAASKDRAPQVLPLDARTDRVELSEAARTLAKDAVQALAPDAKDRLQQIRQRIIGGAYDVDHVVSEVARRIIERGDL
jgi:anti-sigma28 factor (negative regulator of flagellin synthesis)